MFQLQCWTKIFIEPFPDEDEDEEAAAVYDAVLSVSQVDLRPSMYGAFMGQLPTVTSTEDATEETGAGAVSPLTFADLATVSPEAIAELCDVACAEYAPGQTDAGTGSPITRTVSPEVIAEECSTADGVEGDKDEDYSVGVNLSKIVPAPRSLRKKPKISYAALAGLGKVGRPKESVHQKKKRSKAHAESAEPKVKLPKRRSSTKVSKRKTNVSNVEKTNLLDQNLLIHEAQPNISPGSISRRRSNISYEEECSDYSEEEAKRKSVPAKIVKRSKSTVSRVEKDPTFKIKAQRRHSTANVPNPPLAAARNLRLRSNISYYESSISSDESGSTVEFPCTEMSEGVDGESTDS
ncbi:unnamed protein product [Leptosia nina]|uniref:Uncharacterized protein n=1 Tax=Leptosia nina TaxID=320188 RepID=A0AAV1K3Q4_9NEOP